MPEDTGRIPADFAAMSIAGKAPEEDQPRQELHVLIEGNLEKPAALPEMIRQFAIAKGLVA